MRTQSRFRGGEPSGCPGVTGSWRSPVPALRNTGSVLPTFLVAIVAVTITATAVWDSNASGRAWNEVKQVHSIVAYRAFIRQWPAAIEVRKARAALSKLELRDLNAAMEDNNIPALQNYLASWPDGKYRKFIEEKISESECLIAAAEPNPYASAWC